MTSEKKMIIRKTAIIFIGISFLIFTACSSTIRYTSNRVDENVKDDQRSLIEKYKDADVLETVFGVASFYSDKYNGKVAYSGEVYNMYDITAAHPSYQMGTIIRVTNLDNEKQLIIRINDKMPLRPDRIIDLSLGCAQELDFVQQGLAKIKLEVVEWGTGKK